MSVVTIAGDLNKYVVQNWTEDAEVQLVDSSFTESGDGRYISCLFSPTNRNLIGLDGTNTGRIEYIGIYKVRCYDRYRLNSLDLADKVCTLLDGLELNGMYVELGQIKDPIGIEGLFETNVSFRVRRS